MHRKNRKPNHSILLDWLDTSFLCVVLSLFAAAAWAQTGATLRVTLTDPSGAAVPGARLTLETLSRPARKWQGTSGANGRYRFEVPPGRYRLSVRRTTLQNVEQEITLRPGERHSLELRLRLEPLSDNVVVSAEARPIPTTAASAPVSIITRQQIERRQATELAPLLATEPGITIAQSGPAGGLTSLFLDGGNYNYTKVLVDGVPVNEPGGAIDFSNFTLDNVDKVEVVRGAESALTGSDAMTGVIDILSHRGSTRVPLVTMESFGGSFGTGRASAQVSGLAGALDYSVAASYFGTRGQGPNDRFLNRAVAGNFGVHLGEGNSLRLTLRNNTSDAGESGQTLLEPPNLDQHNALRNFSAGLTWQFSTGEHWHHRLTGYDTYLRQLYANPLSDFYTSPDPTESCDFPRSAQAVPSAYCDYPYTAANQYNRAGFEAESSYVARQGSITAGYVYEAENGFLSALGGGHARRNNMAGFLEGRWQPVPRLVLNAGFRVEDNSSFGTRAVPRAGAALTLRNGRGLWGATRVRFSYGQGIKEPRLDQSFGTDPCNPGNPNLRPEASRTYDAGIEQHLARDRVRVAGDFFYNQFRDITSFTSCYSGGPCPVSLPADCPFGGTYFNTDLARARGINLVVEAEPLRWLHLDGNYTYDDTRVLAAPNAYDPTEIPGNRLLRRPVNSGNIALSGALGRVAGTLTGRFVGERTDSDFLYPPLNLTRDPGFATLDVAASFRLSRRASFIAHVDNLLDRHYQEVLGYPALGRGIYAGMRFRVGGE